jgi:hypothetical protein
MDGLSREVFDPSTEDGAKNFVNLAKAVTQPQNEGFARAVKAATGQLPPGLYPGGLAGSIRVQDSLSRGGDDASEKTVALEVDEVDGTDLPVAADGSMTENLGGESQTAFTSAAEVQKAISLAIRSQILPVAEKLATVTEEAQSLKAQLEQEQGRSKELQEALNEASSSQSILAGLGTLMGGQSRTFEAPAFNKASNPNREAPQGLAKGLIDILESDSQGQWVSTREGKTMRVVDPRNAQKFIISSLMEDAASGLSWRHSGIVKSIEQWAKDNGFLGGSSGLATRNAGPTTGAAGSAPAMFLDALSSLVRATHTSMNIWWQFAITAFDPTSAPSKNILVPAWQYMPEPTSLGDYDMGGFDGYTAVPQVIGTNPDSRSLVQTEVPLTVRSYSSVKGGTVGTRPIFIPEFHDAISLVSLLDIVDSRLMQNYWKFENLLIRLRYEANTRVRYNNANAVVTAPGGIAANGDGTITQNFMDAVYTQMFSERIPTYPNGSYAAVFCPIGAQQFKIDLQKKWAPPSEEQIASVSNMFSQVHGIEIGRTSGYIGNYCNFECFVDNSFGVGAAGSVPTVQNTTFGAGAQVTNDNFVFGPGAVGRGQAMPVQIRSSGTVPFNLGEGFGWFSWEGVGDLDNDAGIDARQQSRVMKLRTSRIKF